MKQFNFNNPTAPPPLVLSPPAIPILRAEPIEYEYIIFERHLCCYNHLFSMRKKPSVWKVTLPSHKQSYEVPLDKTVNDMSMIIQSLGIFHKGIYKVEVWSKDILVKTSYYTQIHSICKFISDQEVVLGGVAYGEI